MKIMQAPSPLRPLGIRLPKASARSNAGFTAIELMVVISIVGILAALSAPSFQPLIERWRVRDAAESLTATMYFARSEAIKRGGNVVIVKNGDIAPCETTTTTQWHCGWSVRDTNGNVVLQASPVPTRMEINLASSTGSITIDRWGMASHTTGASTPTNMFFEIVPKGKSLTDLSAARLCAGGGGRIVRKKGTETC